MKIFPRFKRSGSSAPLRRGRGSTKRLDRMRSGNRRRTFDDPSRRLISPVPLIESDVSDTTSNASPPCTPPISRKGRSRSYSYNMNSHVEAYPPSITTSPRIARSPLSTTSFTYTPKKKQSSLQQLAGRMRSFKENKSHSSRSTPASERSGFWSNKRNPRHVVITVNDTSGSPHFSPPPRREVVQTRGLRGYSPERYAVEQDASSITNSIYASASSHTHLVTPRAHFQVPPPVLLNAPTDEDSVFDNMSSYTNSTGLTGGTSEFLISGMSTSIGTGTISTGYGTSVAGDTIDTYSASGYDDTSVFSTGASGASSSFYTHDAFDVMETIREDTFQKKSKDARSKSNKSDNMSLLGSIASDAEAFMSDVAAVGVVCGACANDDFAIYDYSEYEDERRRQRRSRKSKSRRYK